VRGERGEHDARTDEDRHAPHAARRSHVTVSLLDAPARGSYAFALMEADTEVTARPELPLHGRRVAIELSWTDAEGPHRTTVTETVLVGSSGSVGIRIADRTVSRVHAELEPRADGVWIRDLGSRNGTYVDALLVERVRLPGSARIRLGNVVLGVETAPQVARVPLWPDARFGPLLGRSEPMRELFMRLGQCVQSNAAVLVQGATGTGKELVAQAIHEGSDRSDGPFGIVDCAALPEALLEGELFGHARGAFTGAAHPRAGAIEAAHGGTLFLDEIGELPLSMQPKLLRAIEAKAVRRLGETEYRKVDVRFIAATHRDLQAMVATNAFREDLYFRLAVLPVPVPPLSARKEDVPTLLEHFLGGRAPLPDAQVMAELLAHPWAGNVRELRAFAERMAVMGAGPAWALTRGAETSEPASQPRPAPRELRDPDELPPARTDVPFKELREAWLDHLERDYIGQLLETHGRNVTAIAEAARLDRTYVHRLLRKHDL
jgi:DNA-binding NtrC family response regulator